MREGANLMGGKLTVWTAAVSGTEIEIIIPAARAYAASIRVLSVDDHPRMHQGIARLVGTKADMKSM
jgi:hypothetical protein